MICLDFMFQNEICENVKNDPSTSADVTVIFSNKQEHSSEVVEQTIDSSSDDGMLFYHFLFNCCHTHF